MRVDINLKDKNRDYSVFINELFRLKFDTKVAIITNSKVAGLHLDSLLEILDCKQKFIITIPDGEEYKNLATIEQILEQMFVGRLDRSSVIIAFGGGVVSDMAGFVASIYERGIKFVTIPTTLLAQVDASVGGKTGINNKFGKNLIGSFYQPSAVYCESKFLKTLPEREFAAGIAEAIKMAVMFDEDMFNWLENADLSDDENLKNLIYKSIVLKAKAVEADEREKGVRAVLNYGHTFAHVIENQTDYKKFLHGEAVSIGINMANALALRLGLLSTDERVRIENLLLKFDLPTTYRVENPHSFYEAFFLDKKSQNSKIKFILPNQIGSYAIRDDISKDLLVEILSEFR